MYVFGNPNTGSYQRGAYQEAKLRGDAGLGATVEFASGSGKSAQLPESADDSDQFVTHVNFAQKERLSVVQCFNDRNFVYAFGHDPLSSLISVRYCVFLRDKSSCSSPAVSASALSKFVRTYRDGRLSEARARCKVHIGSVLIQGFLVGMDSTTASSEYNLQTVDITMLATEAQ